EENPAGGSQYARNSLTVHRSHLRNLPGNLPGLDVDRSQILLPGLLGRTLGLPTARRKFNRAFLYRHHIVEACGRTKGSSIPVRRMFRAGDVTLGRSLRPTVRANAARPRQPPDEFLSQ